MRSRTWLIDSWRADELTTTTYTRVLSSYVPGSSLPTRYIQYKYLVRKESDNTSFVWRPSRGVWFSPQPPSRVQSVRVQFNYDFGNPVIIICNILTIFEVYESARTFFIGGILNCFLSGFDYNFEILKCVFYNSSGTRIPAIPFIWFWFYKGWSSKWRCVNASFIFYLLFIIFNMFVPWKLILNCTTF